MLDILFSQISFKSCILFSLAVLLISFIHSRLQIRRRVKGLGDHAPQIRSFLPFGIDIIARNIYSTMHHRDLESWQNYFTPHGTACQTVETRLLGLRCVFTQDPENIKAVLATQFEDYGKGDRFHNDWRPFLGDSIFTTDGTQWRASRQLIRPQFVRERVSDLSIFERHVQILLDCISGLGEGERIDINNLFLAFTLDTATEFLLGKSVGSLHNPRDEFSKAFAEVQRIQNMISRTGPANVLIPRYSYNASLKAIDDFVQPFISHALSPASEKKVDNTAEKYTFLHALAGFTQDRKVLRDQIIAVLLAGRDTTAAALSWTFYELARHPDVVVKLRSEIARVVGLHEPPTYENLKEMKYLQNILNEILRLYPSIPFNLRFALRDTNLPRGGGKSGLLPVAVLKNTLIAYSTLSLQRSQASHFQDEDYGSDSDVLEFRPERWQGRAPVPWTYIPFHGGPRTCVGQQFALAEMGYTVTRLLQRFDRVEDLEFADGEGRVGGKDSGYGRMKTEVVLQPANGVWVGLRNS